MDVNHRICSFSRCRFPWGHRRGYNASISSLYIIIATIWQSSNIPVYILSISPTYKPNPKHPPAHTPWGSRPTPYHTPVSVTCPPSTTVQCRTVSGHFQLWPEWFSGRPPDRLTAVSVQGNTTTSKVRRKGLCIGGSLPAGLLAG